MLEEYGIEQLYAHQSEAINAAREEGKHVVISTSTASGKSMVYHLPVLDKILHDSKAKAIYIFPTVSLFVVIIQYMGLRWAGK